MSAFDMTEILEITGDVGEAIKAYLDDELGDEVLDFQAYSNDRGEHSVAIALQGGDAVYGGVLLVMPKPASGEHMYELSGIDESEGPISDFCPQRILDLLSPTKSEEANYWRARCKHRLMLEAGHEDLPPVRAPGERWDPSVSGSTIEGHDWRTTSFADQKLGPKI